MFSGGMDMAAAAAAASAAVSKRGGWSVGCLPSNSSSPSSSVESLKLFSSSAGQRCHGMKMVGEDAGEKALLCSTRLQATPSNRRSDPVPKMLRWWEKGVAPNMKEIGSAQELVDSLVNAGDQLVVVDFFKYGCGGCKTLHPKICQFAEKYPDVMFLQVNHEELRSMCYSLHVHVLPFFRFYRGAHGRLCSFSCTTATIKKFRDAIEKHSTERCSIGPAKGLEEEELLALSANKDLEFEYTGQEQVVHASVDKDLVGASRR